MITIWLAHFDFSLNMEYYYVAVIKNCKANSVFKKSYTIQSVINSNFN